MVKRAKECAKFYNKAYLDAIATIFLDSKIQQAKKAVMRSLAKKVASTLSGKDSIVSLHILASLWAHRESASPLYVIINRYIGRLKLPEKIIEDLVAIAKDITSDAVITVTEFKWNGHSSLFNEIAKHYDFQVIVTGLRRQENGVVSFQVRNNVQLVAPLWQWKTSDVWAYLVVHDLYVPDVYCNALSPFESLQRLILT